MAITVTELIPREFTFDSVSRRYQMVSDQPGVDEEAAFHTAILAAAPATVGGAPRTGITFAEYELGTGVYEGSVTWGAVSGTGGGGPVVPTVGTFTYKFNFQAQGGHFVQSLANIYSSSGLNEFGGAINVVNDGTNRRVEGFNVAPPAETFVLTYAGASGVIDETYQRTVEGVVGTVNSVDYKLRPAGSLMLSRCTGSQQSSGDWLIEFGFAYIPNQINIPVGGLTVPSKDGFDLLWVYYEDENVPAAGGFRKQPQAAFVERIFYRSDFAVLGLP